MKNKTKKIACLLIIFTLLLSYSPIFNNLFLSPNLSTIQEEDISITEGYNIYQGISYTYSGTFYDDADPTFAWTNAILEFDYNEDVDWTNTEYAITDDFTNTESKFPSDEDDLTVTNGSYYNFTDIQSNDDDYAYFNYTGVGLYNATYSFTDDNDGDEPNGWTDGSGGTCTLGIIASLDEHKKVLQLDDNDGTDLSRGVLDFNQFIDQTIEFWVAKDAIGANTVYKIQIRESGTIIIDLLFSNDDLRYYDSLGVVQDVYMNWMVADMFAHIKIELDDTTNTFDIYINGVLEGNDLEYRNNVVVSPDSIRLQTDNADTGYKCYIDALDFSSDPSYEEGRNREENWVPIDYTGTYSFDNDDVGSVPSGWGETVTSATAYAFNKHRKVIKMENNGATSIISQTFDSAQTSGTVEFWMGNDDITKMTHAKFYHSSTQIFIISIENSDLTYYLGGYNKLIDITNDTMYHIRVDFECGAGGYEGLSADTYYVYVNGVKFGAYAFMNVADDVEKLFFTANTGAVYNSYVDAVGYSWDTGYDIGDNLIFTPSMLGNYPASYSFYKQPVFEDPFAWITVESAGEVGVIAELDGHKKVVEEYDNDGASYSFIYQTFSDQETGIVEFWVRRTGGQAVIYLREGGTSGLYLTMASAGNDWWYYDGVNYNHFGAQVVDTWYHIKLVFDCNTDSFDMYQDGILQGVGFAFENNIDSVNQAFFMTEWGTSGYYIYYDGIGYSWDQNYNLGDTNHYNYFQGNETFEAYNQTEIGDYTGTYSFDNKTESEVYYGTYDFREQADGTSGSDINGFYYANSDDSNPIYEIVASEDGHKKVVELAGDGDNGKITELRGSWSPREAGTVEHWFKYIDHGQGYLYWFMHGSLDAIYGYVDSSGNNIRFGYGDGLGGATWTNTPCTADIWHHLKIEFDCATDTHSVWLDGVNIFTDENFYNDRVDDTLYYLRYYIAGGGGLNALEYYIDAIGYDWDTTSHGGYGYYTGWNINPYDLIPLWDMDFLYDTRNAPGLAWESSMSIVPWFDNHKNVFNLTKGTPAVPTSFYMPDLNDGAGASNGAIEFWWQSNSTTEYLDYLVYTTAWGVGLQIHLGQIGNIRANDGGGWVNVVPVSADLWYHIRLTFECGGDTYDGLAADTYKIYVNGTGYGAYDFNAAGDTLEFPRFDCPAASIHVEHYIDAFSYTWESDYTLGDNINSHGQGVIDELVNEGWYLEQLAPFCSIGVSGEYNSHKKILNMTDIITTGRYKFRHYFSGSVSTDGYTFEFYHKTDDNYKGFDIKGYSTTVVNSFYLVSDNGNYQYNDGGWQNLVAYSNDVWYHHKIVLDFTNQEFDWYVDDVFYKTVDFSAAATDLDFIEFRSYTGDSDYSNYIDAISYSWEEPKTYFYGSYNQHCAIEAIMDFTVDISFTYYERFILQVNSTSRHFTSTYTNAVWLFYNFETSDWVEITDTASTSEVWNKYGDVDVVNGIDGLFDSDGNMKFRYYTYNSSAFYLCVDELNSTIYFKTILSYDHTIDLLGSWKYRFVLDDGLGSSHNSSWIYFNVIVAIGNFHAISESDVTTRWIMQEASLTPVEDFHDDISTNYWGLGDTSLNSFKKTTVESSNYLLDNVTALGTQNEIPVQWTDFAYTYGSSGVGGDTENDDGVYAYMNSEVYYGSETYLGYIIPNGDLITNWADADAAPHFSKLDEATADMNGDGGNIREKDNGVDDRWDFTTLTLPTESIISKLVINTYIMSESVALPRIVTKISSNAFADTPNVLGDFGSYVWSSSTVSGLTLNQADLNSLYINVEPYIYLGFGDYNYQDIETVYIEVYYKNGPYYRHNSQITWDCTNVNLDYLNTFYYDYATTTSIEIDLDIWDWNSGSYVELESNNGTGYITGSYDLASNPDKVSGSNQVKIRFETTGLTLTDFDVRLDQLMFEYKMMRDIYKNYFGGGYVYMQTNTTELISLKSVDFGTTYTLNSGDYFELIIKTSSDSETNLVLLKDTVVQKTFTLSESGNSDFSNHTIKISVDEYVVFDQLKISSTFEDMDYIEIFDIKTYKYVIIGESADFYVDPDGSEYIYLSPETYNLRIFENGLEKINTNITITSATEYHHYTYDPIDYLECRVSLFSGVGTYLDFNKFHVQINRSLNEVYTQYWLLDDQFYVDEGTNMYFAIYDVYDTWIKNKTVVADVFIDITLAVYSLTIKNMMDLETIVSINSTDYELLSQETIDFILSQADYQIDWTDDGGGAQTMTITLDSNQAYELNTTYHTVYFGLFTYDGLGLNRDWVRFYINGTRKDFGRNIIQSEMVELIVLDYFNNTLANETINAYSYSEYNIYVQVYSMYILNRFTYRDLIFNITQVGSGYYMNQLIPSTSALLYRFIPNINYTINATYVNGTIYNIRTINLTDNSQIESFGIASTPEEYPKDVYFGVYTTTGLGINHDLLRFYIDGNRTNFGFNRIVTENITLLVRDYFNTTLFNQDVNTSGINEYNILITLYSLKVKNEAKEISNYTLSYGVLETTGFILPEEITEYQLSSNNYVFEYTNNEDNSFHTININLNQDRVYILNSTYYNVYIGLYNFYGLVNKEEVKFYINNTRADFGFNTITSIYTNLLVLDYFNSTLYNQTVRLEGLTEYSIFIRAYTLVVNNLYQNQTITIEITRGTITLERIIEAQGWTEFKLFSNITYNIVSYINETKDEEKDIDLDEEYKIVDFGFYETEVPIVPIPQFIEAIVQWALVALFFAIIVIIGLIVYFKLKIEEIKKKRSPNGYIPKSQKNPYF